MAALSTLVDAFTSATINTALWNTVTGGAASLDTVNDQVVVTCPTASGAVNTFGSGTLFDARGSQVYAQIGVVPNGNGGTRTSFKLAVDANNSVAMRYESGVFKLTLQTAGATVTTTLPTYDPHLHRWWRLRESGGTFFGEASPDGLNWTVLTSTAYSWSAAAMTFSFQIGASLTEVSGNAATIGHVNLRDVGSQLNPNWPVVETGWGPYWDCNAGEVPPDRYVSLRTIGSYTAGRGKQYELDQAQAGTSTMTLPNTDGSLDPDNHAGPFAGRIRPFQPVRRRNQWPPTINLLTQAQATGGDTGGQPLGALSTSDTGPRILTDTDGTGGAFTATASAWQGGTVAQFAVGTAALAATWICYTAQPAVRPGQTYTVQLRVRNITPATSVQVAAGFRTRTATDAAATTVAGSTATLTGSATAGWTPITVTATADAASSGMWLGVQVVTAPGATCSVQVDGWQIEKGAVASPWVCPGVWTSIASHFTERWPSAWLDSGTRGVVTPSGVDAFALLSQYTLDGPLAEEINSHNPRFLYKLDDPAGSTSATDFTGAQPPIPVANGKNGASSITFGTAVTASDPVNGTYTGSPGTVAHFNNPSPGQNAFGPCTYLSLTKAGITGPVNPAAGFSRMIAFRYAPLTAPAFSADLWMAADKKRDSSGALAGSYLVLFINGSGNVQLNMGGPTGAFGNFPNTFVSVIDGNWHLAIVTYDPVAASIVVRVDGQGAGFTSISPAIQPTGLTMDSIGAFVDEQVRFTSANFAGDISFACEWPTVLSGNDRTNLYTAWRSACSGESTDTRYARILRYAGYTGATALQAGLTTAMGPANFAGQNPVTALQAVVDTEGGSHFVDGAGTITLRSRSARYNTTVPKVVFGERTDLGEIPYEECLPDFDSTHLGSIATVTQDGTGQVFTATDAASSKAYAPRTLTRTVNVLSPLEAQDAANYIVSRYRQPATRVATLRLNPSANASMWAVCLALELGTRVRVMRRPLNAPAIQLEAWVEKLDWAQDDGGKATLTLQCSPVDTTPYSVFAAWHTTLKLVAAAGAGSITVNASADNTNPLNSQMTGGQLLILGQNTPNQETVTVSAVGATSAGWTSAVLTLAAPTTKSHAVNDPVNEPLPTGITDPAAFDVISAFDTTAFAY